jgi:predicted DNA-binding transcriptional regulator AlpA
MTACERPDSAIDAAFTRAESGDEMIFADEILRRLGHVSDCSLRRWCRLGRFPKPLPWRPGRRAVWARSAVEQWFREQVR